MKPRALAIIRDQLELVLYSNHPCRLVRAKGRRVECVLGVVWITAYNQSADIELRPGEVFIVPNDGLTLVEAAIGSCHIRVDSAQRYGRKLYQALMPSGLARLVRGVTTFSSLLRI